MKEIYLFSALLFIIIFLLLTFFEKYVLKERIKWLNNIFYSILTSVLYLIIVSFILFYGEF